MSNTCNPIIDNLMEHSFIVCLNFNDIVMNFETESAIDDLFPEPSSVAVGLVDSEEKLLHLSTRFADYGLLTYDKDLIEVPESLLYTLYNHAEDDVLEKVHKALLDGTILLLDVSVRQQGMEFLVKPQAVYGIQYIPGTKEEKLFLLADEVGYNNQLLFNPLKNFVNTRPCKSSTLPRSINMNNAVNENVTFDIQH